MTACFRRASLCGWLGQPHHVSLCVGEGAPNLPCRQIYTQSLVVSNIPTCFDLPVQSRQQLSLKCKSVTYGNIYFLQVRDRHHNVALRGGKKRN